MPEGYAARNLTVRIKRNRCNTGPIANIQRALWFGDADYAMPKTSDDLIAPNYVERLMGVLLAHHDCAMCHSDALMSPARTTSSTAIRPNTDSRKSVAIR